MVHPAGNEVRRWAGAWGRHRAIIDGSLRDTSFAALRQPKMTHPKLRLRTTTLIGLLHLLGTCSSGGASIVTLGIKALSWSRSTVTGMSLPRRAQKALGSLPRKRYAWCPMLSSVSEVYPWLTTSRCLFS